MFGLFRRLFARPAPPAPPIGTCPVYTTDFDEVVAPDDLLILRADRTAAEGAFRTMAADHAADIDALTGAVQRAVRQIVPLPSTAATLLIEHSGSMRGINQAMAAVFADRFATLCADLGLRYEVLGFTTPGWRGEPVLTRWALAGKPTYPGQNAPPVTQGSVSLQSDDVVDESRKSRRPARPHSPSGHSPNRPVPVRKKTRLS